MSYTIIHRSGAMEQDPPLDRLDALLAELDEPPDPEHPDIAVSHETGWTLSAFSDGRVLWGNVEEDDPERLMLDVSRERVRALFGKLAEGDIAAIEAEHWQERP